MMEKAIVAPGLFQDFGGPRKTIGMFSKALDSVIYSFCDGVRIRDEGLTVENSVPVESTVFPVGRQFLLPQRKSIRSTEAVVAGSGLISCHMFYRHYALWVNKMYRKYETPYWFVPHGILDPWVMTKGALVKKAYWQLGGARFLKEAKTVICATTAERDKAAAHFDLPDAVVLPWPVELVVIDRREAVRLRLRCRLGIPVDAHLLLYFGRLHPMKQPLETILALAAANVSNTHLIIVGNEDGVSVRECIEAAVKCGIEERVHVVGPVYGAEKYDYLLSSDAYISLSHRENFNHTAAESMAAGLPVLLSPGNDLLSEICRVSCFFEMEDNLVGPAADAIRRFSEKSKTELLEMGLCGRQWVEDFLSFDQFKEKLNTLACKYGRF